MRAPREVDPAVGSTPDVFALDRRARLLVEDGRAHLGDAAGAEVLHETRVLIADDVADTGLTLQLVKEFTEPKVGEVRVAVLYEKSRSVVHSEYVWRRTDRWIDFPWSAQAPVGAAV